MLSPFLGVVVVTFNSADVIIDCLESLFGSDGVRLAIAVVDNGSTDGTPDLLRKWAVGNSDVIPDALASGLTPTPKPVTLNAMPVEDTSSHSIALIETGDNLGFAGGVNRGLAALAQIEACDRFWILNPDSVVPQGTARAFATEPGPKEGFSLMGGRVTYFEDPDRIQIDGGTIDWRFGVTRNVHRLCSHRNTPPVDPATLDFITGASMVASRRFYEQVGAMQEDYFLYYEEVDWALRRGDLPLAYCADGLVYHKAGTAIGSPAPGRVATAFSQYFKHRARLMFLRRHKHRNVPLAQLWSVAKAGQLFAQNDRTGASALLAGAFNRKPPEEVSHRLPPQVLQRLGRL